MLKMFCLGMHTPFQESVVPKGVEIKGSFKGTEAQKDCNVNIKIYIAGTKIHAVDVDLPNPLLKQLKKKKSLFSSTFKIID